MTKREVKETRAELDESQLDWYEPIRGINRRPGLWVSLGLARQLRLSPELSARWPENVHYGMVARTYDGTYLFIRPSREKLPKCLIFSFEKGKNVLKVCAGGLMSKYKWELEGPTTWPAEVTAKGDIVVDLLNPIFVGRFIRRKAKKKGSCPDCAWRTATEPMRCSHDKSPHYRDEVTPTMTCHQFELLDSDKA